jgi:hypothetical protein
VLHDSPKTARRVKVKILQPASSSGCSLAIHQLKKY